MLLVAPATGVWVPVTLVIFWVCEVVEKVVEKTASLASARTWSKARKNAALHKNHLITTYVSITWKGSRFLPQPPNCPTEGQEIGEKWREFCTKVGQLRA